MPQFIPQSILKGQTISKHLHS